MASDLDNCCFGCEPKEGCCSEENIAASVSEYYGKTLQTSNDLQTNACQCSEAPPVAIQRAMSRIHDEVLAKYYGCGLIVPELPKGLRILDLGCGAGQDVYILSQLVGSEGFVVGIDMTEAQLAVANKHLQWHMEKFGFERPNVQFILGKIECLDQLGLEENSFDVIVSNCVINLCADKLAVLRQAHRLLRPGGEMYFSDVYSNVRVPKHLREDPVLWGECLSGALYWNDFLRIAKQAGFTDPRLVRDSRITINNKKIEALLGFAEFFSATYRLWKINDLESDCEDYGQAVIYKGTIEDFPYHFDLDHHHHMQTGKVFPVCGNTYRMLAETRFAPHFTFIGNFDKHYGIFEGCGSGLPFQSAKAPKSSTGKSGGCC